MTQSNIRNGVGWGLLLLFAVVFALGVQSADAAKKKNKGAKSNKPKSGKLKAKSGKPKTSKQKVRWQEKRGGRIDPTTVPIIDEDFDFCIVDMGAQVHAGEAHAYARGTGVVIAVLDGGFDVNHPAIAANVLPYGFDAVDGDHDPNDWGDGFDGDEDGLTDLAVGHGTFVTGMILAAAPGAMILPVRVRDDEGYGTDDEGLAGLDYAVAMGADVINYSGSSATSGKERVRKRIKEIEALGIPVIVSAGNDGGSGIPKAAKKGYALAVAAVDASDHLAPWSNYRADVDMVCAPGVDLIGPFIDDTCALWSGTSFATGFVSGGAALLLELHPDWTAQEVFARLLETCDPAWDEHGLPLPVGGRINLHRAVAP